MTTTKASLDPILLRIAKSAILEKFDDNYRFDRDALVRSYPFLNEKGAVFVTLNKTGALRGCIGSIIAHRRLLDDLIQNAQSAAFGDPRFLPLSPDELDALTLEVSLLSEPEPIEYSDFADLCAKVRPHIDGLILKSGFYSGTFLPQVWEQLPTPKLFLEHLAQKAGATPDIYAQKPDIYRYTVEHIEERFNAILPLE